MVLSMLLWFSATYLSPGAPKTTAGLALGIIAGTDFPYLRTVGRIAHDLGGLVTKSLRLLGLYALALMGGPARAGARHRIAGSRRAPRNHAALA